MDPSVRWDDGRYKRDGGRKKPILLLNKPCFAWLPSLLLRQLVQQSDPERFRKLRAHRHAVIPFVGEGRTLDRIFLGHQHRQLAAEIEIAGDVTMMVGERMRHHADTKAAQHLEEALRIADSCHGMHAVPAER